MKFYNINEWLINEAGQEAGKLELVKTNLEQARNYTQLLYLEDTNKTFISEFPNFDEYFKKIHKTANLGKTQRKDMPVIDKKDVASFQMRLEKGRIDLEKPYAVQTDKNRPFKNGLTGKTAKDFLSNGLKDHSNPDDKINVKQVKKKVKDLKPIQKQIYFDKSIKMIYNHGLENTKKFLEQTSFFITSKDGYIIDGHHRWLAANLINPEMKVQCLDIDLDIKKLLPLSLAYSDAIGNKRNK